MLLLNPLLGPTPETWILSVCLDPRLESQTHVQRVSYCGNREAIIWSFCVNVDLPYNGGDANAPPNTHLLGD